MLTARFRRSTAVARSDKYGNDVHSGVPRPGAESHRRRKTILYKLYNEK